jgi:hypothetical protein
MSVPFLKALNLALVIVFAFGTTETVSARPKKQRVERSAAPAKVPDYYYGTPIIMQGMKRPKRPVWGEDRLNERAERQRMIPRGRSPHIPPLVSSPSPPLPMLRQPPVTPYRPAPINSFGDRVTQCIHSFPLNAGVGNNPADRDAYVRYCVNN